MQNISPIKQRILSHIDTLGISKREFYAKTGISRGTLESKTGITEEIMAKFIAFCPNISLEWLISGKGEMLKGTVREASQKPKEPEETSVLLLKRIEELTVENYKLKQEVYKLMREKKTDNPGTYDIAAEKELTLKNKK